MVWDKNFPQNTDQIKDAPPDFQANWAAIEDTFSTDHNIPGATDEGEHKQVTFTAPISKPTGAANKAILYPKDDGSGKIQMFAVDEDDNDYQLTNFMASNSATFGTNTTYSGANSGGWTFLPGGLIMFYGTYTPGSSVSSPLFVVYPFAFPSGSAAFSILISTNTSEKYIYYSNSTSTGFRFNFVTGPANIDATWMAIGK